MSRWGLKPESRGQRIRVRGFPQDARRILLVAKDQFLLLERNGTVFFDPISIRLIPFLLFIQPLCFKRPCGCHEFLPVVRLWFFHGIPSYGLFEPVSEGLDSGKRSQIVRRF